MISGEISDEARSRPWVPRPERHPVAAVLYLEAAGLAGVAAACVGAGAVVTAGFCLVLAAVAGCLAASIAEGFPRSGSAVIGFEGVTVATAVMTLSRTAAVVVVAATATAWWCVHRRGGARHQIRRPVSCQ